MVLTDRKLGELKVRYQKIFFSGQLYYENVMELVSLYPEIYCHLKEEYREYEPIIKLAMEHEDNIKYVPEYEIIYALKKFINIYEKFPKDTDYELFISQCKYPLNYIDYYPYHIRENKKLFLKMIENQKGEALIDLPDKFLDDKDVIRKIIEEEHDVKSIGDDIKKDKEFILSIMEYDNQVFRLFDLSILSKDDIKNIVCKYPKRVGLFPKLKNMCIKYLKENKINYYDTGIYHDDWDIVKYMISINYNFSHDHLNNEIFLKYCIPLTEYKYFDDFSYNDMKFYERYDIDEDDMMKLLQYFPMAIISVMKSVIQCQYIFKKGRNIGKRCEKNGTLNERTFLYECKTHWNKCIHIKRNSNEYPYSNQFWISVLYKNRGVLKYVYIENKEVEFAGYKRIKDIKGDVNFHY